jgi:hypothetical protein
MLRPDLDVTGRETVEESLRGKGKGEGKRGRKTKYFIHLAPSLF